MYLSDLEGKYPTDKFDLGYIDCCYNSLFADRESPKKVLEIGVFNGGSLLLWRDWFINAEIHGVDIRNCLFTACNQERIVFHQGDAYSSMIDYFPDDFDIAIDDGPHTLPSWLFFVSNYALKLRVGGILVLEDIIDISVMQSIIDHVPSGFKITVFEMVGKQKTPYLNELWKNGLNILIAKRES